MQVLSDTKPELWFASVFTLSLNAHIWNINTSNRGGDEENIKSTKKYNIPSRSLQKPRQCVLR